MPILNNKPLDPFGTNTLFNDIQNTNAQIQSMNIPQQTQPMQEDPMVRRQRAGNMMLALSDVLRGQDPSQGVMQRQKMLQAQAQQAEQEAQTQRMLASMTPEQRQIYNMKKMGLPDSYIQSQFYPKQEKKGTQRHTVYDRETGKPIRSISAYDQEAITAAENNPNELIGSFAGLSEDKPSKITKSDFVIDILTKITSHVPTDQNPKYKLTPQDLQVLDTISNTDPMKQLIRNAQMGYVNTPVPEVNTPIPEVNTPIPEVNTQPAAAITTQEEFDKLPEGAKYIFNGQEFIKGQ
jgi:hypothetical protein